MASHEKKPASKARPKERHGGSVQCVPDNGVRRSFIASSSNGFMTNVPAIHVPVLCILAALSVPSLAAAQSGGGGTERLERKLVATRAVGEITLDGVLDEPTWAGAPMASNFIQNEPLEGEPATFDTEVRV